MPFNVNNNIVITDDRIVQSVSGPVGSRPGTPVTGMMFFNTTDSIMEVYNGTAWISTTVGGGDVPNAWSWGTSLLGGLGDGTTASKLSPVSVVGGITDWISVDSGGSHGLAIRANGTLYSWGSNSNGQLGDTTTANKSSPALVAGSIDTWVSVSGGSLHSLALRANGTLYAWGSNATGQLGDNSTIAASKSSPVLVAGGFGDWASAAAGDVSSLGVRANGVLYAWGSGYAGMIGDGTTVSKLSPVIVSGGFGDWASGSIGSRHCIALRDNGTLYAWGLNTDGQLGDTTTASKASPVLVAGGITDWISISAGNVHNLAIRGDGRLYAWGNNGYGRLGDTTTTAKSSPIVVAGGITDWVSASGSITFSLGLRANGTLYAWGNGAGGRLGDTTVISKTSPILVAGGFTDWISASAGNAHSTGIRG